MDMKKDLQKSIFSTIVFFDLFDYPLTELEIWKFLYAPQTKEKISLLDIKNELLEIADVGNKDGFYFLKGRAEIINIRRSRYSESFNKFSKALRAAKFFSLLPFVRMIAIGNFIPSNNAKKEGDIDFFIITKPGRLWLARFIMGSFSHLLGWRPTKKNKQDKICLTFFISEEHLNLKKIALAEDIYFYYWLATLYPVYNKEGTYQKFISENDWMREFLPNFNEVMPSPKRQIQKAKFCLLGHLLNFSFFERIAKKIQIIIMPEHLKALANKNTSVLIDDKILKFHNNDRRQYYQNKFITILNSLWKN